MIKPFSNLITVKINYWLIYLYYNPKFVLVKLCLIYFVLITNTLFTYCDTNNDPDLYYDFRKDSEYVYDEEYEAIWGNFPDPNDFPTHPKDYYWDLPEGYPLDEHYWGGTGWYAMLSEEQKQLYWDQIDTELDQVKWHWELRLQEMHVRNMVEALPAEEKADYIKKTTTRGLIIITVVFILNLFS